LQQLTTELKTEMTQKQDTVHYTEVTQKLHNAQMTSGCVVT